MKVFGEISTFTLNDSATRFIKFSKQFAAWSEVARKYCATAFYGLLISFTKFKPITKRRVTTSESPPLCVAHTFHTPPWIEALHNFDCPPKCTINISRDRLLTTAAVVRLPRLFTNRSPGHKELNQRKLRWGLICKWAETFPKLGPTAMIP